MTSTRAHVAALTHDGHDLLDADGIFLDLLPGHGGPYEHAAVRGEDDVVPGLPGMTLRNRQPHRRVIELTGWVTGATQADYDDNREFLHAWLSPIDVGTTVVTLRNGAVYTIQSRLLAPSPAYNPVNGLFAYCAVDLESVDPDWVLTS